MKKAHRAVSVGVTVLIYKRKGGAGGVFAHTQLLANGLYKRGFARAHFAIQRNFPASTQRRE